MTNRKTRRESHRTAHAILTLIILFVTAVSTALLVPPAWRAIKEPHKTPTPTPPIADKLIPAPKKTGSVCGLWRSETSQKNYRFICTGEGSFQIEEADSHGQMNTGSGTFTQDGVVKAELLVSKKSRTAHLYLHLSPDGQSINGSWVGDNPENESGRLAFHRIQEAG